MRARKEGEQREHSAKESEGLSVFYNVPIQPGKGGLNPPVQMSEGLNGKTNKIWLGLIVFCDSLRH